MTAVSGVGLAPLRLEVQRVTGLGGRMRRIGLSHASQNVLLGEGSVPVAPAVWVLTDGKPGHTTQSVGLAEELGWPFICKELDLRRAANLPNAVLGVGVGGVSRRSRSSLVPPWPDLLIACGRRLAPVARWVRRESKGKTRIVQLGRKGSDPAGYFDLSVVPAYSRLLPHANRVEVTAPPNRAQPDRLAVEGSRWKDTLAAASRPRLALLVGGSGRRHRLSPQLAAALGRDVMELARRTCGSVFATTSRRTPSEAANALEKELSGAALVYRWNSHSGAENPYLGLLALADAFIVTGDSASMLAEACATRKPVLIYPVPRSDSGPSVRWVDALCEGVVARAAAQSERSGRLGSWCQALLYRGIVRPPPDLEHLHRLLVERGLARTFDLADPLDPPSGRSDDTALVAQRVRQILSKPGPKAAARSEA